MGRHGIIFLVARPPRSLRLVGGLGVLGPRLAAVRERHVLALQQALKSATRNQHPLPNLERRDFAAPNSLVRRRATDLK